MKKIIIFDFNRTIYNPEAGTLFPEVGKVMNSLLKKEYQLFLLSHIGTSSKKAKERKKIIYDLGLEKYFQENIILTRNKSAEDFEKILAKSGVLAKSSFVVGDRVRKEIAFANTLGCRTIWLKKGRFAVETPRDKKEKPKHTVENLEEILEILV